jgi:hypothetical protein
MGKPGPKPKDASMPSINEMYPSDWLKASDCQDGDMTLTITNITKERIGNGRDAQDKWALYFEEVEKGMILNKTNTMTIAKLYGDDTDDWIGKKVTLYATEVQFQKEMVDAIRIRSKPPRKPTRPTQPTRPASHPVAQPTPAPGADEDDIPF